MTSLFEYIASAVVDGKLPADFSLPKLHDDETMLLWADGALDGVSIYHMGGSELSKDDHILMSDAVRAASKKDFDLADQLFKMLGNHIQAIYVIDELQKYVIENQQAIKADNLFEYAVHLLFESDDRECVKFGLSLLEILKDSRQQNLKEAIRTVGLSDEFTLFAIFVMRQWKDGNNEIWQLANKVHGWGRIHAIEYIEADTEEIRKWLLMEGVHNDVMPAYSALTCWKKSHAEDILRSNPSRKEFTGIRDIIEGLLDEGPVPGLSEIQDRDEIILIFLEVADTMELILDDYEVIYGIYSYYKEEISDRCEIALVCKKMLTTYRCRCLILEGVKKGRCIDMAINTGVNVKPYVFDLMNSSFKEYYYLCGYLIDDQEYRDKTIALYRHELPLEEMKTRPTNTLGLGKEYWKQSALEFLFQELRRYPFEGQDFVKVGLQSAPVRTRNGALYVLEFWVSAEQKSLSELLPDMWELLSKLIEIEPDDNARMRMEKLLSETVVFESDNDDPDE